MSEKFELSGEQTHQEGQINQDELILQQQRQIQQEISESTPLVGELESISSLNAEYSSDEVYLQKIKDLASKYKFVRRTRPDGNCFFRGFSYGYIEKLLSNKDEFKTFYTLAENSKSSLVELGFPQFTVEDFYDTREKDFYSCFIEGDRTVIDFCHQEVEPMYKESDHIHIMAACSAMNTGVRVVYMDRGNNKQVTEHDLPEGSTPYVHLLYRPGHYDILYPN
ncbi:ubiquitin thiolesterase protein otub [Holotrichia oblita]|uniref:Ubiquitin thiolesterase protein otub n=1 Tax=Holotrichia oblita TaxID=644536 RepID=A0ACB9T9C6_HOLOL|nr:ubiquitin thiolesterase protein otub [Holotrichia oblita]